jgi:hypothetical protein
LLRNLACMIFALGSFAFARENASPTPDDIPFRVNADDPCLVSRYSSASVVDVRAVEVECGGPHCSPFDKTFAIPAGAWKKGGIVATLSVQLEELAKFFGKQNTQSLAVNNLLVEIRVCHATRLNAPCGDDSQQLMRMKGNYLFPLSLSGNNLQFEIWVDPRTIASNSDFSSCPKR